MNFLQAAWLSRPPPKVKVKIVVLTALTPPYLLGILTSIYRASVVHDTPYEAPRVTYKSRQVKLVNEVRITLGETHRMESGQRVIEHGENALSLVRNSAFAYGGRTIHQDTHPVRLGTAGQVTADLHPSCGEAHFASPVKAHRGWYLRH